MKNMGKITTVNLKVTPEFKALLIRRSTEEHRSITAYIEWLVLQDAEKTEPKNWRG